MSDEQLKNLTSQDTEEEIRHEEYLKELEAKIFDDSDADLEVDLGELPYDDDCQRWDELEKDFDRVFDEAKKNDNYSKASIKQLN